MKCAFCKFTHSALTRGLRIQPMSASAGVAFRNHKFCRFSAMHELELAHGKVSFMFSSIIIDDDREFVGSPCLSTRRASQVHLILQKDTGSRHGVVRQNLRGPPLEAILVIFGRRALIFFLLIESSWKNIKNYTTSVRMSSGDHLGDAKMWKKGTSLFYYR